MPCVKMLGRASGIMSDAQVVLQKLVMKPGQYLEVVERSVEGFQSVCLLVACKA